MRRECHRVAAALVQLQDCLLKAAGRRIPPLQG